MQRVKRRGEVGGRRAMLGRVYSKLQANAGCRGTGRFGRGTVWRFQDGLRSALARHSTSEGSGLLMSEHSVHCALKQSD